MMHTLSWWRRLIYHCNELHGFVIQNLKWNIWYRRHSVSQKYSHQKYHFGVLPVETHKFGESLYLLQSIIEKIRWYFAYFAWNMRPHLIKKICEFQTTTDVELYFFYNTVKPGWNDHLYDKIQYLWLIQWCVLMKNEGTNLLLITISAFWSSSMWPLTT